MNYLSEIEKIKGLIANARTQAALDALLSLTQKAYPLHEATVLILIGEFSDYERAQMRLLNPKRSIVTSIHSNVLDLLDKLVSQHQSVQETKDVRDTREPKNPQGDRPQSSKPKNDKNQKEGFTELGNKLFKK